MIAGIFHQGSGLGNQLHRYVMTRVLAADLGVPFTMIAPENFKGGSFMSLNMGEPNDIPWTLGPGGEVIPETDLNVFAEKKTILNGIDVRGYDPEIKNVQDNTLIDGEFQDERYFEHRTHSLQLWLKTEHLGMPNDVCVIGFRGGEFKLFPELYLPKAYWDTAIYQMRQINPAMKFLAVTDDPESAREMLPAEVKITHEISMDWRMVKSAKYLIIANSSFYIFPALLNTSVRKVIAPRYWARRSMGMWATPQNFYSKFSYI